MPASNSADRRGLGVEMRKLHADAARHHLLLAAGIDEQQVFLAVVEEAEVAGGRAFRCRPASSPGAGDRSPGAAASARAETIGASTPWVVRKMLTRSRVSGVMRAPSLRRETNFPSLTARRPKVDSAMPARRQNSEMLSNSPTAACAIARNSLEGWIRRLCRKAKAARRGTATTKAYECKVGRIPRLVEGRMLRNVSSRPRGRRNDQLSV